MPPTTRTTYQRDRRFTRVRRLTRTILIGSGVASGAFVGYAATVTKPFVTGTLRPHATTTVSAPPAPRGSNDDGSNTPAVTPAPTSAPASATPTCYSTPSGTRICQ